MYSWNARQPRAAERERVLLDVFLALVLGARQRLARPPVVGDLVIVPLREHRDLGVEREQVLVEQIVFVVAAEFGQRLGRLRFLLGDDVLPDLAVRQLAPRPPAAVGVDGVAGVDEEIRPVVAHGRVGAHAAARVVDAPALAGGVARPDERDRAPVARRGAKAADHRLARRSVGERQVLEADAIEDVLAGGQDLDQHLGGEIALRQRIGEHAVADASEAVGGGNLDLHARGPVGAGPDHAGIDRHVAGLQPMADGRHGRRPGSR